MKIPREEENSFKNIPRPREIVIWNPRSDARGPALYLESWENTATLTYQPNKEIRRASPRIKGEELFYIFTDSRIKWS